ncbi:MAG: hypothetical protein M3N52_08980, partial [Actinomycetota bacterium]|nr:hypothetical protein [Actinomycetota bacterium]
LSPALGLPALAGALLIGGVGLVDAGRARPPRGVDQRWRFRFGVALLHGLQPLARIWGRARHASAALRDLPPPTGTLAGPVTPVGRGVFLLPAARPRGEVVGVIVDALRRAGIRVMPATGWENHDARFLASTLLAGELVTSDQPRGCVAVRIRRRLRMPGVVATAITTGLLAWVTPLALPVAAALVALDVTRGWRRTSPLLRRTLRRVTTPPATHQPQGEAHADQR